jgi:hypothetical protein
MSAGMKRRQSVQWTIRGIPRSLDHCTRENASREQRSLNDGAVALQARGKGISPDTATSARGGRKWLSGSGVPNRFGCRRSSLRPCGRGFCAARRALGLATRSFLPLLLGSNALPGAR